MERRIRFARRRRYGPRARRGARSRSGGGDEESADLLSPGDDRRPESTSTRVCGIQTQL